MSTLADLQADFLATLHAPAVPADPRIAIYHAALRSNWVRALAAAYPVVQRLVGEEFFAAMAGEYVRQFPSRSGDLNQLGGDLPAFLESFAPAAALAYLADVARLEWALHEASFAPDAARLDSTALAAVPPQRYPGITLILAPWVRLLESPHPVVAIWEANQAGRDGSLEAGVAGPDRVLVMRDGFEPRPQRLDWHEWRILTGIWQAQGLGAIVDGLGEAASALEASLARHVRAGVICGLRLPA